MRGFIIVIIGTQFWTFWVSIDKQLGAGLCRVGTEDINIIELNIIFIFPFFIWPNRTIEAVMLYIALELKKKKLLIAYSGFEMCALQCFYMKLSMIKFQQ